MKLSTNSLNNKTALFHRIVLGLLFTVIVSGCKTSNKTFTFYVFSDTHLTGDQKRFLINDSMITAANNLYLQNIPDSLSYLKKQKPKGVLICGDLTDGATQEQWIDFTQLYGLNGENKLKYPVYENYGNHDGDSVGVVRQGIKERNKQRRKITNVSKNGLHYSFDRGHYHFVSLGSYPANGWDSTCSWCHYFKDGFRDPQNSLAFLKQDLAKYANSRIKVVLYFHYGWDDFSKLWWTEKEQEDFYNVIKKYNIVCIFSGHDHSAGYRTWKGINVYSAGSPQHDQHTGSFLVVQATKDSMFVLEREWNKWGDKVYKNAVKK